MSTSMRHLPFRRTLSAGRVHFQHGPIDLIVSADGEASVVHQCIEQCWKHFADILRSILDDLPLLKAEVVAGSGEPRLRAEISRRMWNACAQHAASERLTSMAAVAGSVADQLIGHFHQPGIERAFINNGGDIAFHMPSRARYVVGLHVDPTRLSAFDDVASSMIITGASLIRGVATSGWKGRSFSFGVADAVTVLASNAASADAAATVIGNAVNVESPRIERRPADTLKDNTDLGGRLVTSSVGRLEKRERRFALRAGARCAEQLLAKNLIAGAIIHLQGEVQYIGKLLFDKSGSTTAASMALVEPGKNG